MTRNISVRILIMALGAVAFWVPVTAVSLITGKRLSLLVGTLLPPISFFLSYFLIKARKVFGVRAISIWMLAGVFVFGPWFLYVALIPTKGGFYGFQGWIDIKVLLISMIYPLFTLAFSSAHRSSVGLLLTTVITFMVHSKFERDKRSQEGRPKPVVHDFP
jgi:hypothetical protein